MIEVTVSKNDSNQRFDRYLKKLFVNAQLSVIYKNIRKKNFKINGKRAHKDDVLKENDIIKMYITDKDYKKWTYDKKVYEFKEKLNIVYEDDNIIIMDKPSGVLTHSASKKDYGNNMVDYMISYLYKEKKVNPKDKTFIPAVVNRLDRNTSGLLIGAKNHDSLIALNEAIRKRKIDKFYLTLVKGKVEDDFEAKFNITKNENKNKIKKSKNGTTILTDFKVLSTNGKFSELECKLITGKTHQIRFSLKNSNHPILGDLKYGDLNINKMFSQLTGEKSQILLAYKLKFNYMDGLEYLNGKEFISNSIDRFNKIRDEVYNEL